MVSVPKKPGADEILKYFRQQGIKTAVASSSSRQQIEGNLKKSGLEEYIDVIVSGTEVEHGKPSPDIFLETARRIGCKPQECYVFEDSENGIKAGSAAGCRSIMIPDLFGPSDEVQKMCAGVYLSLSDAMKEIMVTHL